MKKTLAILQKLCYNDYINGNDTGVLNYAII